MNFGGVEKIAAAILYEGYILYPYRPSAIKNRQRWNFGTLYPRVYAEAQRPEEPFRLVAECLVIAGGEARLDFRLRFLQLMRQRESAEKLSDPSLAWDEAVERTSEHFGLRVGELISSPVSLTVKVGTAGPSTALRSGRDDKFVARRGFGDDSPSCPAPDSVEGLSQESPRNCRSLGSARDDKGEGVLFYGEQLPDGNDLQIALCFSAQMLADGSCKVRLEVVNATPLPSGAGAKREEALPLSMVSAHLVFGVAGGEFVSLLDPGEKYRASAAACSNVGVFPVLAGEEPAQDMMLCSPIILYDYPNVAPESAGDFFDGTEMDEMLTLRVLTLTDAEKEEMRNGDPRARKILERTENLTSDAMLQAHGAIRSLRQLRPEPAWNTDWNPFEESKAAPESVRVFGIPLRVGDRVRLCPKKRADIMDMALAGKIAVIEAIEQDFEDRVQLAVVVDDDPGREFGMMRQPGHRFFYAPDEVEPVLKGEPA